MPKFERIPSGIPGLDKIIEGGFIKGSAVLISGGTGTGKTIFCTQFIYEGLKRGEKCMYLTLEEKPEDIITDVKNFGFDLKKYVDKKQLILEYKDPFEITDIVSPLIEQIKTSKIKRVVIDSTSLFGLYFKESFEVRKQLYKLITALKAAETTALLTAEVLEDAKGLSRFGVEEFIVDGIILLHYMGIGKGTYYSLQVRKMRRTNHGKDIYPMMITDKGIKVGKPVI